MPTLHCETGNHNWDRPSQRGRKPKNCPEHKPIVEAALSVERSVPAVVASTAMIKVNGHTVLIDRAIDAITKTRNVEHIRQIAYIIGQFRNPNREDTTSHLETRLEEIIRNA
jgi:hypothetical protein